MKVIIATGIYPPDIGGPATVVKRLVHAIECEGHTVQVLTLGDRQNIYDANVYCINKSAPIWLRIWRTVCWLRQHVDDSTLLIATDVSSVGIPARLALLGKRTPFVLRLGGEWCWEYAVNHGAVCTLREYWEYTQPNIRDRVIRRCMWWVMQRAQRVIVTADLLKTLFERHFPGRYRPQFDVIENTSVYQPKALSFHAPSSPRRLLYVGRFAPVKNLVFLAEVLRTVHELGCNFQMTFVGDGQEFARVRRMLLDVPNVVFLGRLAKDEVRQMMDQSDLLVLPSLTDIAPNVVHEALSRGLPCLVTEESGLPQNLGGVRCLSPRDHRAWVDELRALTDLDIYLTLQRSITIANTQLSETAIAHTYLYGEFARHWN